MKKSDVAMIVLIASISMIAAYFIVNSIPVFQASNKPKSVSTFEAISPDVADVDPEVFNASAINPTVEVFIGGSNSAEKPGQ